MALATIPIHTRKSSFYALVIFHHGPQARGIAGTLTFGQANPLKAPFCGDCSLVKPLMFSPTACYLFIHGPFCNSCIKLTRVFPPHCRGKTLVKAPLISTAIPRPPPGGGGWSVVTNDQCIRIFLCFSFISCKGNIS